MKISTAELKKFKSNSSFIKKNGILPILDYLKFKDGVITKTNLHSFIEQKATFKGEFLVPEMNLFNFLSRSTEGFIDVYVKDGMCIISDGKLPVVKVPTEDIVNFPSTPTPDEEQFELNNDVMCAINIASTFIDYSDAPDARCHVFVGSGCVAGIGFITGYREIFTMELPKIVLLKEFAQTIGKFNEAKYQQNERYDFFTVDDSLYGFIKPTYPFFDGLKKVGELKEEWDKFYIDKNEIINFTETCTSQTTSKGLVASITMKKDKVNMVMIDPDFNTTVNHSAEAKGVFNEEFNFNPAAMSLLLKTIPNNDLTFHFNGSTLFIQGESYGVAMIQKMLKNNVNN